MGSYKTTNAKPTAAAQAAGPDNADFVEATRLATTLLGDSIATNLFMLGYAWQKGLVPVGEAELVRTLYGWGARNCEMHLCMVHGECPPLRGVTMPTFMPETG